MIRYPPHGGVGGDQARLWKETEQDNERWRREAEFFDSEEYSEGPIPDVTIQRYLGPAKPWMSAEFPFWVLGDVRGRTVLEVGCGDGANAILLALKGARVVGIDVSPKAIEVAAKRAALHGVSETARFECVPLEVFVQNNAGIRFDVICGWAVLHHLLPVLESFLVNLKRLAGPDTKFLFVEPISLWRWLRRLRLMLPIAVHGTPDERPLEYGDMDIIDRQISGMQRRYFYFLVRIMGRLIDNYELAPRWQRTLYSSSSFVDGILLNTLGLRGMSGSVVIYSRDLSG